MSDIPTPPKPPSAETEQSNIPSIFGLKKVIVLTTAMLSFIPFWKAAAVVLCDFGSSAFYAGGIAMKAFGPAFPYFILAIMLFSGLMLMVSIESCSMFVRGGVYSVVKSGLGDNTAKVAVSAILFDFLITGPISSVTAGHYLAGFVNSVTTRFNIPFNLPESIFSVSLAVLITLYFWRQNVKGISDSSSKASKIIFMGIAVSIVLVLGAVYTILTKGAQLPPVTPEFTEKALGWTANFSFMKAVGAVGVIMALGHSVLAVSGLETLSQVYREIEYPKIQNLKKAALVVFLFALLFTGGLTFLSSFVIPKDSLMQYNENLLSGLAMELNLPWIIRLIMQGAIVGVGVLMLAGAVNTSLIGSNSLVSRIAEDGIITDWFRKIHRKYGTTHRVIHIIAILQLIIILLSRGQVYVLGEAYAFGVLWSFVLQTLSLLVMRFTHPDEPREFRVPFNIRIGPVSLPVGLTFIFLFLFTLASMNLLTKSTATISGLTFTAFLYLVFSYSERLNAAKANEMFEEGHREKLNTSNVATIDAALSKLSKEHRVVIGVKDPDNLYHLDEFLKDVDNEATDIILVYVKPPLEDVRFGPIALKAQNQDETTELFSKIILIAEKYGKTTYPVIVESNDPYYALSQVARAADADEILLGLSGTHGANDQMERMVMAWSNIEGKLSHPVNLKIVWEGREVNFKFN
ncbi:Amino acid transporter [Parelusimicrobium proximum]|uniref:amino acid permease n=1 Tax=Parelusimicrobium proximum TaxID=3228953 RepID=UPI003D17DB83